MNIFETILEIIGWLKIVASPTVGAAFIGFIIYLKWQNNTSIIIAIILLIIGFILGIIWATRSWNKH
ncbi:MAG TPA: hypothetical protein VGO09_02325 [Flavisolibacter sp.]|nr:hypothetical protein [Flavisolibacter sp.]